MSRQIPCDTKDESRKFWTRKVALIRRERGHGCSRGLAIDMEAGITPDSRSIELPGAQAVLFMDLI